MGIFAKNLKKQIIFANFLQFSWFFWYFQDFWFKKWIFSFFKIEIFYVKVSIQIFMFITFCRQNQRFFSKLKNSSFTQKQFWHRMLLSVKRKIHTFKRQREKLWVMFYILLLVFPSYFWWPRWVQVAFSFWKSLPLFSICWPLVSGLELCFRRPFGHFFCQQSRTLN